MSRSKSPLWLSGALLISTYAIYGWLSTTWHLPVRWIILVAITLLVNIIAIYFDRVIDILVQGVFGANTRSLLSVMGLATLYVIILTKLPIFASVALALATALLMSIDLNERSISRRRNFIWLTIGQICGWGMGFVGHIWWEQAIHVLEKHLAT
jgi:hypothetical protein